MLTRNFLFIALRNIEAVKEDNKTVTVNSLGFAGTHAVKREEDLELINKHSPIGILEKVSMPVPSPGAQEETNVEMDSNMQT